MEHKIELRPCSDIEHVEIVDALIKIFETTDLVQWTTRSLATYLIETTFQCEFENTDQKACNS